MIEDIQLNFIMRINQNNEEQIVEYKSVGKRYYKNQSIFLIFEEPVLELNKNNQVTCIIKPEYMTIIRKGFTEMNQKYCINDVTIGSFQNQYGKIETNVLTKYYHYQEDEIKLTYDMIYDNEVVGNYELNIQIKGVGKFE